MYSNIFVEKCDRSCSVSKTTSRESLFYNLEAKNNNIDNIKIIIYILQKNCFDMYYIPKEICHWKLLFVKSNSVDILSENLLKSSFKQTTYTYSLKINLLLIGLFVDFFRFVFFSFILRPETFKFICVYPIYLFLN